jgi:uncharacterized protein (TIGR00730 family)
MSGELRRICVFCGSSSGSDPAYAAAARELGATLATAGVGVVFGGGRVGMMGHLADGALGAGGEVIGVIPRALVEKELGHAGVTELRVVETMHDRKALMASLADAFAALPGGFGTLEEFFEALTWAQLGLQKKPCALLNVKGFFDALLEQLDRGAREGFIHGADRILLRVVATPAALLTALRHPFPDDPRPILPPEMG